jgi:lysophospholipase L1-like esterase
MIDKRTYLYGLTKEFDKAFPDNRLMNIVVHGHSQTRGYTTGHTIDPFSAYSHQFHKLLKHRFPFSATNVIVTGIGGECSITGAKRFEDDVLCHKPDLITIDYALNDRYVSKEEVQKSWESMVNCAKEKNIPILLLTPTLDIPSAYEEDKLSELRELEKMIIEIGREKEVGVVQVMQAWEKYLKYTGNIEDLLSGVNHASELGHSIIANEVLSWIPYIGY